jgi:putative methionine-R-sulfoxide reductase with GAF domain
VLGFQFRLPAGGRGLEARNRPMFQRIAGNLRPPHTGGRAGQLGSILLHRLLVSLLVLGPLTALALAFFGGGPVAVVPAILGGLGLGLYMFFLLWLVRQGRANLAGWLVLLLLFAGVTYGVAAAGGVRSNLTVAYLLVVVLSSLILPAPRAPAILSILSVLALLGVYWLEVAGFLRYPETDLHILDALAPALVLILVAALVSRGQQVLHQTLRRARASEAAAASIHEELQALNQELEAHVIARTRALALSSEVSRRLSTVLDRHQLVDEVVSQLQQAFNYYHVHVYLLGDSGDDLVLAGGTGEAGAIMRQRGHKLTMGQGLVGRAALTRLPVLAPDVHQDRGWLPNPLLPQTKGEVAVPILLGEELLGVVDVQHEMIGGLGAEDVDLLTTIANQVAVALQNSRLYETAQQEVERQVLLNTITQRIQSTTSVEQALQVAVRELGRALPGQVAAVRLQPDSRSERGTG